MVERTLPKPDTRVRFPSALSSAFYPTAFAAEAGIASGIHSLARSGISALSPSRSPQASYFMVEAFLTSLDGLRRYVQLLQERKKRIARQAHAPQKAKLFNSAHSCATLATEIQ